jgi:hypothetical protein
MKTRRGSFRLRVNEESTETTRTICDADPRAKNKRRALRGHFTSELERCHRVRRWIFDALPYLGAPAVGVLPVAHRGVYSRW